MAEIHPSFRQPDDLSIPIWRYTDLSKFVWMLQRKALWFVRADLLLGDDPYEGYPTRVMADPASFVETMRAGYLVSKKEFGEKEEAIAKKIVAQSLAFTREGRRGFYVTCWHANKHESQAIWKLYTSMNDSICIRSTTSSSGIAFPTRHATWARSPT
jgi:hypothetical protein